MEETRYGLRVEIPVPYERAVDRATASLKAQGFGVLTTIDVKQTLKEKLDRDFRGCDRTRVRPLADDDASNFSTRLSIY
jgi:uncharacterized protein (DUF302 family)